MNCKNPYRIYNRQKQCLLEVCYHKNQTVPLMRKCYYTNRTVPYLQTYITTYDHIFDFISDKYLFCDSKDWIPMPPKLFEIFFSDILCFTNGKLFGYQNYHLIGENNLPKQAEFIKKQIPKCANIISFETLESYKEMLPTYHPSFETYSMEEYLQKSTRVIFFTKEMRKKAVRKQKLFTFLDRAYQFRPHITIYQHSTDESMLSQMQEKLSLLNDRQKLAKLFLRKYSMLFGELYDESRDDFMRAIKVHYQNCPFCHSPYYTIQYKQAEWAADRYTLTCLHCERQLLRYWNSVFDGGMGSDNPMNYGEKVRIINLP